MKHNFISLDEVENKGCVFKGERRILKVVKGSIILINGVRKNERYALEDVIVFDIRLVLRRSSCLRLRYDVKG